VGQPRSQHIRWEAGGVHREQRERARGHRGVALWFTGLSGSGKTTLAHGLERVLVERGCATYVLDGDNVRHGLSSDLGFSPDERRENIRRIGEVAKLFVDAGMIVLCCFVSPYRSDRDRLRGALAQGDFVEIHVKASLAICQARDPKGLYEKAASGEIGDMTGVGAPYEPPDQPELVLDTEQDAPPASISQVLGFLEQRGYIDTSAVDGPRSDDRRRG
jgi:adenylylsulfate kinase